MIFTEVNNIYGISINMPIRSPVITDNFCTLFQEIASNKNKKILVFLYTDYTELGIEINSIQFDLNESLINHIRDLSYFLLEEEDVEILPGEALLSDEKKQNHILTLDLESNDGIKAINFYLFYPENYDLCVDLQEIKTLVDK